MRIDPYTKTVLTVIALCLIYLCFGRPAVMTVAEAQDRPTRVVLVGWEPDPGHVIGLSRNSGGGLPVSAFDQHR